MSVEQLNSIQFFLNTTNGGTLFKLPFQTANIKYYWTDDTKSIGTIKEDIEFIIDKQMKAFIRENPSVVFTTQAINTSNTSNTSNSSYSSYSIYMVPMICVFVLISIMMIFFKILSFRQRQRQQSYTVEHPTEPSLLSSTPMSDATYVHNTAESYAHSSKLDITAS